ncbi:AAA family ATPase [Clostridium merdae]|uniref:AAA family ATPase n=1 Tax=Clostridium merdae TaxID=1958780 RepID=UPI000A27251B|nr:AAA family ATPase [Clostridium merdae]
MKLLSLILDNYKGIKHFELGAQGANVDVFGDNATGKTTLADAYFWLLFGKDSAGRSDSNFEVKTRGTSGLDYSVKGAFLGNDGQAFTLQRVYREKFRRKNGEAEREFQGHETDFYINDVPKPKKDYTSFISSICDEQTFMLLTDPDMFAGKLKWDARRDILLKHFAPTVDDLEIINAHDELKPLIHYIGTKSVDDYSEITKVQRQKINKQMGEIPGRIDEAEKAKPFDLPQSDDGPAMLRLQKQKMKLENDISAIRNGETAGILRNQILEIKSRIAQSSADYSRKSSTGNTALETEMALVRSEISQFQGEITKAKYSAQSTQGVIDGLAVELDELRQKCMDTANQTFDEHQTVCPTCGQDYPPEQQEKIRGDFKQHNAEYLEKLETKGKELATTKQDLEKSLQQHLQQQATAEKTLAAAKTRLERLSTQYVKPEPFEHTTHYCELIQEEEQLENQLVKLDSIGDQRVAELNQQLQTVTGELETVKRRALNTEIIAQQDKRIEELKQQERQLGQELIAHEDGIRLAELFTQLKAQDIEEKVNFAFRLVRWKLFDVQINGGIKPCCEATVKGIEYGTNLNSAARMNAGLDIINTLGLAARISVPVWVDNAESVTSMLPIDAQVIRLHVSARDKQLRAEVRS